MTAEVNQILDGGQTGTHFADATADADLARYLLGYNMRISRVRKRWPTGNQPMLEQLEGEDAIWAICLRKPPPGWRLIGRFLAKDVFVGLDLRPKGDLMGGNYGVRAAEAAARWSDLFPTHAPIRSTEIGDHLGHIWTDMDNE